MLNGFMFGMTKRMVRASWTKGLEGLDRHVMTTVNERALGDR